MVYFRHVKSGLNSQNNYSKRAASLFKASFVTPIILRKHPIVASLHRGVDGALVGVIVSGAVMTSLALHSQHLWTVNFSRLHLTRDLIHRLQESTSILERHFIRSASSPESMVSTKSAHLLYIDSPQQKETPFRNFLETINHYFIPITYPITNGY